MPYLLTVPNRMRVFMPSKPGAKVMYPMGTVQPGQKLKVSGAAVMFYDHRDKLVLKLSDSDHYLLVQEIDVDMVFRLSHDWTQAYERSWAGSDERIKADHKSKMADIEKSLAAIMRQHIRPELHLVGDIPRVIFDEQGPGVHPILW